MAGDFSSRLKGLLDADPRSQKEIALCASIGESTLVNYKAGRIPKAVELFSLAATLGVSAEWLLTGKGGRNMPKSESLDFSGGKVREGEPIYGKACRMIPVIGWAHAGQITDYDETPDHQAARIPTECRDSKAFGVRLEGDSMRPLYQDGDMLVVMPSEPIHHGCLAVVRHADGVLFRRVDLQPEVARLIPLNERYSVGEYRREDILWAYPVWGAWRQIWK